MRTVILAAILAAACTGSALADQKHGLGTTPVRHICPTHAPHGPPPPKATALCRDGSYTTSTTASACSNHCGVEHWIKRSRR